MILTDKVTKASHDPSMILEWLEFFLQIIHIGDARWAEETKTGHG